jgi:hypothetical protein
MSQKTYPYPLNKKFCENFRENEIFRANFSENENFRKTKFRENLLIFAFRENEKKPFSFPPYALHDWAEFPTITFKNIEILVLCNILPSTYRKISSCL